MRIASRVVTAVAVGISLVAVGAASAQAESTESTKCSSATVLSPRNEVRPPDTTDPVESRAFGAAAIYINGTTLRYAVAIINPTRETFVAGHIHAAPKGQNGGVVVPLFSGSSSSRVFKQFEETEITEEQAAQICGDLAGHYINYHTTQDLEGAIRGQLS